MPKQRRHGICCMRFCSRKPATGYRFYRIHYFEHLAPFTTLISKIINNVFGHRGLLHYSLFWIVMTFFTANYNHFTQGLFFGVFGHLFLDACTYKGIPALSWIIDRNKSFYVFPKKWRMYVGKRRTNNVFYIFTAFVTSGIIFLTMH